MAIRLNNETLSFKLALANQTTMRSTALSALILATALCSACATDKDAPRNKNVVSSEPLRVAPSLLGASGDASVVTAPVPENQATQEAPAAQAE